MKKILLLLSVLISADASFSQNAPPPHTPGYILTTTEMQVRNAAKANWYSSTNLLDTFFYNNPDTLLIKDLEFTYDTSKQDYVRPTMKDTILYTGGKETKYLLQQYDSATQAWQNFEQYLFSYNNKLSTTIWQRWIAGTKTWRNIFKYSYTYKDTLQDSALTQRWDSTKNTWNNYQLSINNYDNYNRLILEDDKAWDSTKSQWDSSLHLTYTYTDNIHNLVKQYSYSYWDTTTLFYSSVLQTNYSYNNLNQLINDTLFAVINPIPILSESTPVSNDLYYYDKYGNQIEKLLLGINDADTTNAIRTFYTWKNTAVLPVDFISFNAVQKNDTALLNWSVANEINTKGYEIEKSINGFNYSSLDFVTANGKLTNYTFTDKNLSEGTSYYRIKEVDNDGKYMYSSIQKIAYSKFAWKIFGNPVNSNSSIQLMLDKPANISIQIISSNGNLIKTIQKGNLIAGDYSIPLNMDNVNAGMYLVRLMVDDKAYTATVVK